MKKFQMFLVLIAVIFVVIFIFLHKSSIIGDKNTEGNEKKQYQENLKEAQEKLNSFNKNILPFIEFTGIIENRNYERKNGDKYSIQVRTDNLKFGDMPNYINFLYDFRNPNIITIYYQTDEKCFLDDTIIGDTIKKRRGNDFFIIDSKINNNSCPKMYYKKEMFLNQK